MTNPSLGNNNSLVLALTGVWAVFLIVSSIVGISWIVRSAHEYSPSELSKQIMIRGGTIVLLHFVYITVVLLIDGVAVENVLCGLILMLTIGAAMFGMNYMSHRQMPRMEQELAKIKKQKSED